MSIIEGMEKVRKVIEENRQRKLTKHKKISNHTILEIDSCSPLEILKLQKNLVRIAEGEGIGFVFGKGKHKPEIQKLYEELEEHFGELSNEEKVYGKNIFIQEVLSKLIFEGASVWIDSNNKEYKKSIE